MPPIYLMGWRKMWLHFSFSPSSLSLSPSPCWQLCFALHGPTFPYLFSPHPDPRTGLPALGSPAVWAWAFFKSCWKKMSYLPLLRLYAGRGLLWWIAPVWKGLEFKKKSPKHDILFMKAVQVLTLIHFSIFPQNSCDFILEAKNKNFVS